MGEELAWANARQSCQQLCLKGDLASIKDDATMKFIRDNVPLTVNEKEYFVWIGAQKENGYWRWSDGTTWNYENWAFTPPSYTSSSSGINILLHRAANCQWFAERYYSSKNYLCQCDVATGEIYKAMLMHEILHWYWTCP